MKWLKKKAEKNPTQIIKMVEGFLSNIKNKYDEIDSKIDKAKNHDEVFAAEKLRKEFSMKFEEQQREINNELRSRMGTFMEELHNKFFDKARNLPKEKEE